MSIYAKKDEKITCENGHEMFIFIRDVYYNESYDLPNQIKWINENTMEPIIGTPLNQCKCHCGAEYIKDFHASCFLTIQRFHFKDGWR